MYLMKPRFTVFASITLLTSSLILLSACGGSSSSSSTTDNGNNNSPSTPDTSVKTGVFIDAPVKGLAYKTATQSGVTNDKGEFNYITGETVTYSLDGLELGSAAAQAQMPVTLISDGNAHIAQLLQTLDTDADPDLIDVSGIKLDDSIKIDLNTLIANSGVCQNIKCIGTILDSATLTKIQTDSQVALVNQTVVSQIDAVKHVYQSTGSTPWQSNEVSGKVYAKADAAGNIEIDILRTDGTFVIYSYDVGDPSIVTMGGTWQLNNGELLITSTIGDIAQYNVHKISQDDTGIDFWPENTADATEGGFGSWNYTKPLTLATLDGKHFADDTSDDADCSARTFSFSGATLTVREQCTGGYSEIVLTASEAAGVSNLIQADGVQDGKAITLYFALTGGDLNSTSTLVMSMLKDGVPTVLSSSSWTAVSAPLQP